MTNSAKDLLLNGLMRVTYPTDLRPVVERSAGSWKRFTALPQRTKDQFEYKNVPHIGSGVGYERKSRESGLDPKENFHITLGEKEGLLRVAAETDSPDVSVFISEGVELLEGLKPFIVAQAQRIEDQYGLAGFAAGVAADSDNWVLRFLHYFPGGEAGKPVGDPHVDKCVFTLHVYEDGSGVKQLTFGNTWIPMDVNHSETVIIPGMRLQYGSNSRIRATCHQILATEKTVQEGRRSIVCFVTSKQIPVLNSLLAGRMQDRSPGFNYALPHSELAKWFEAA